MNLPKKLITKGFVLFLKAGSMGIKFVFFSIILPKEMLVENYGNISLLITTITFFIFLVGFDFYNYVHRDFINDSRSLIISKLLNQFIFNFLLFIILTPLFYWVMIYNNLPFFSIAVILLFTEYFGQEVYRLLIVFSKPVLANLILFFRSSFWVLALLLVNNFYEIQIDTQNILIYWAIGNSLLVIFTILYCFNLNAFVFNKIKIDWGWIKKGFYVSIPFLISTITLKIIELSDRFIINYFYTSSEVGIYSFYSNISNSLNVVINTTVVIMIYPKILLAFKKNDKKNIPILIKVYKKEMFIFLILAIILSILFLNPLLNWIGKEEYFSNLPTFWVLLTANVFFNISLIPHVVLYALHKDREIIIPVILACLVNLALNFILLPAFGIVGAAIATLVSFLLIMIFKLGSLRKLNFSI